MSRCRSCGAEIKFIKLKETGKWHPVNPVKRIIMQGDGPETIITDAGEILRGKFAAYEDGGNRSGYISHFATCPDAGRFRKGR